MNKPQATVATSVKVAACRTDFPTLQQEVNGQKAALLLAAVRAHPRDLRVPDLLNQRWMLLTQDQEPAAVGQAVLDDIAKVAAEFAVARSAGAQVFSLGSLLILRVRW